MKRLVVTLVALLLLAPFSYWFARQAGFLKSVAETSQTEPSAVQSRPWWRDVERPAYFNMEVDAVDDDFERKLEAAIPEIEKARDAIDDLAESERYKILAGPDAPLYKDAVLAYRDYLERFADTYRNRTTDTGKAKQLGEEFLAKYLDRWSGVEPIPDVSTTADLGTSARKAGSKDPLLAALYYQLWQDNPEYRSEALDVFHESADRLEAENYPAEMVMTVRGLAWNTGRRVGRAEASNARKYLLIESAVRFLAEAEDSPESRLTWWQLCYLIEGLDEADRRDLYIGALENGEYNEFAMHMLAGWLYRDAALAAQTSGSLNPAGNPGEKRFRGLMARAEKHYLRAWFLEPTAPEPPTELIVVAHTTGEDPSVGVDWFQVTTQIEVDAFPAYTTLLWTMTPSQGGSPQEMIRFAEGCLDTDRWDTIIPGYSLTILRQIRKDFGYQLGQLPGVMDIVNRYVVGARRAIASGAMQAPPSSADWALAAALYVQAGRYEDAHAVFQAFGDQMTQRDFDWTRSKLTSLRGLCAAMTGPANVDLPDLRRRLDAPMQRDVSLDELNDLLAEVKRLRELDDRDVVQPYWEDCAAMLDQLQTYHRGEWVEFTLDENLPGLSLTADTSELSGDGTLRIASEQDSRGAVLSPLAWFEPPLLIEGEFAGWDEHADASSWGIHVSWSQRGGPRSQGWRGLALTHGRHHIEVSDIGFPYSPPHHQLQLDPEGPQFHRLRMKVWSDEIHHSWESGRLYVDQAFERDIFGKIYFGGVYSPLGNSGQMRRLRLRKLNYRPPSDHASDQEFRDYWQRELEYDTEDVEAHILLGVTHQRMGQHSEAERAFRKAREVNPDAESLPVLMGLALINQGRSAEAISELEQAIDRSAENRAIGILSWILSSVDDGALRDPQRALELAELSRLRRPSDWVTFRALAAARARLGDYEQAADWMRQAISAIAEEPSEHRPLIFLGDIEQIQADLNTYLNAIEAGEAIVIRQDD